MRSSVKTWLVTSYVHHFVAFDKANKSIRSDVVVFFFFQFPWKRNRGIFNVERVELSSFVPYEGDLEPLATVEEAAKQEARMAEELEEERRFQARFTREVDASAWYEKLAGF